MQIDEEKKDYPPNAPFSLDLLPKLNKINRHLEQNQQTCCSYECSYPNSASFDLVSL